MITKIKVKCIHCGNEIEKIKSEYERRIKKKAVGFFCNLQCSGSYFNAKHLAKYRKIYNKKIKNYSANRLDKYSPFKYYANKARSRSKQKGYETDLNIQYLKQLWDNQNGLCPYTGIEMELGRTSGDEDIKKTPIKASLDRIDPNKGYFKGNVEFVCYCINVMKNDFTKKETIEYVNLIKSKSLQKYKDKLNNPINLLLDILNKNISEDKKSQKDGESWNVFNLKLLYNLLLDIKNSKN